MKKLSIVLATLILSSCMKPKDWHCECEVKATGASDWTTIETEIPDKRQSEANAECTEFGEAAVRGNGSWKCKVTVQ